MPVMISLKAFGPLARHITAAFYFIYLFNHANRDGCFLCANVYEGSEERHQTCSGREAFLVTLVCLSCWQVAGCRKRRVDI